MQQLMSNGSNGSDASATPNSLAMVEQQRAISEVQAAMIIARSNPRSTQLSRDRILNACASPKLAETAVYQYAKGGTNISGPSIRLAETLAQNWGNLQFGVRELEQRQGESVMQAYAWDVETNVKREATFTVPHKRSTRKGMIALEDPRDIYEAVANNGARRLRACILAVIPPDIIEEAVNQCEATLNSTADCSPESIKKMVDSFSGFGVTKAQIEARIQRHVDAIQPAQMAQLKKIYASLRDGMSIAADWFVITEEKQAPAKSGNEAAKSLLTGDEK